MWIVLAIIAFVAGQVYLFHCLGKLDRFLEHQQGDEPQRKVLSIAFSDPTAADSITEILESFSIYYPEMDIVLLTGQKVLDAVYEGRASVGFLPVNHHAYTGLNSLPVRLNTAQILSGTGLRITPLEDSTEQEIIWKRSVFSSPAEVFVRYLRDRDAVGSRNTG